MSHPNHSNAPGGPRAFDNTSKLVAIAIGVLAGIAGLVVGIVNPFMSDAASTQGVLIDTLFGITLGLATAVFVIVQGFLLYSIIRFGREPGDETDAVPVRGNTRLEIFWTAVPAIVILFVGLLSYQVLADIERPKADQLTVEVKPSSTPGSTTTPSRTLRPVSCTSRRIARCISSCAPTM